MPADHIVIGENGSVIELTKSSITISGKVPAGKVLVDGLGVGDVGNIVLRDRRQLSQDGIMIVVVTVDKESCHVVSGPDIVSRGFVYVREAEDPMDEARDKVQAALDRCEKTMFPNGRQSSPLSVILWDASCSKEPAAVR